MPRDLLEPETQAPRAPGFWLVLGALVVAQLVAFWMLCSHQVDRAQARSAETQMAQTALADCLQYIPGSTVASCTARVTGAADPAVGPAQVTPVNFNYR